MIMVNSFKYLSGLLFCSRDLGFVASDVVLSKGGFLVYKNDFLV